MFRHGLRVGLVGQALERGDEAPKLTLYSYDGNQFTRLVREVLVELDLPYELRSTGKGSPRRDELRVLSGKTTAPFLVDQTAGVKMPDSADIVAYLYESYG